MDAVGGQEIRLPALHPLELWQETGHPVLIAPGYFALTYAWHLDKELLRSPEPLELALIERNVFRVDHPDRFVALHVFNPVTHMKLVELAYATQATDDTKARAQALCEALGKTAVNVPDTPGFIVNRLLFPYLFDAVNFQAESGLSSEAIDTAMKLGAGHPMGPLALIDYVGLDVSKAIAEQIGTPIPARIDELIAEGALGKKAGRGFYDYS